MTQLDLFAAAALPAKKQPVAVKNQPGGEGEQLNENHLTAEPGSKETIIMKEETIKDAYQINFKPKTVDVVVMEDGDKGEVIFENSNIGVKIKSRQANGSADGSGTAPKKVEPRKSIVTRQPKSEFSIALNEKLSQVKNNIKEGLLKDNNAEKKKKERAERIPQKRGRKSLKELDIEYDLIQVPDDEILFQKQYYSISEVAGWFNVNTSLLRFWENEFDILKPRKNRKGDRLFRPEDVKNLQLIHQLLRQRKFSIEGAKEYIKTNKNKADTQMQLVNTLQKFRSFLLELKANL